MQDKHKDKKEHPLNKSKISITSLDTTNLDTTKTTAPLILEHHYLV